MDVRVKSQCPHCGARVEVRGTLMGKSARCPGCRREFLVAAEGATSSTAAGEESPTGPEATVASPPLPAPSVTLEQLPVPGDPSADGATVSGATLPATAGPPLGRLGRFQLQAVLGQGGCGRVYRAYDPQLDRTIALKVPMFVDDDGSQVLRFQMEARAAAQLRHPHIVPTFDSGQTGNQFYIASQYIAGKPLSAFIREGAISPDRAVPWTVAVARALAYAHGMGIVHRDIKPHNVMLDERGQPQLMDFGLAKRVDEQSDLTAEGSVLGTPAYMAPEQASGEMARIGPRSDQYSLGATLYELLSGKKPFEGPPIAVLTQLARVDPPPLRSLVPNLHPDLEAICQKAMQKEPERRYADCDALADDLERWQRGEPTLARPVTTAERMRRWIRRNPGLAAAFGTTVTALLLAAGIGIWFALYQAAAAASLREEQVKTLDALRDTREAKEQADQQRVLAEEGRALANAKTEEARGSQYAAEMLVAESAWNANRMSRVREMLRKQVPPPPSQSEPGTGGQTDLRGWEWHFQDRLANLEQTVHFYPGWRPYFALSPSGEQVALVAAANSVHLLPTADWQAAPLRLEGLANDVWDMGYHPSGKRLVTTSRVPEIVYWNLDTQKPLWRVKERIHGAEGNRVTFTRDGKSFVVGADDGALLFEATDEAPPAPRQFRGAGFARAVTMSLDGRWIAAGSDRNVVRVWNTETNADFRLPVDGAVRGLQFDAAAGRLLVSALQEIVLADVAARSVLWKHRTAGLETFRTVKFFPDESRVVAGDGQGALTFLDAKTGELVRKVRGHDVGVEDLDFRGDEVWSRDLGGTVRVWREPARPAERVLARVGYPAAQVLVDPGGAWFAVLHESIGAVPAKSIPPQSPLRTVTFRSFADGTPAGATIQAGDEIAFGSVSLDGRRIVLGLRNGHVEVWDTAARTRVHDFLSGREIWNAGHKRLGVHAALFDAAGKTVYAASAQGHLKWWNVEDGQLLGERPFAAQGEIPLDGDLSGEARLGAVAYRDRLEVVKLETGELLQRFPVATTRVEFSPEGKWLAVTLAEGTHAVLDVRTGRQIFKGRTHVGNLIDAEISADGLRMFTSGSDRAFRVWDLRTGQEVRTLQGIRFNPVGDGGRIVTSDTDGTIRLYDGRPREATGDGDPG